MPHSYVTTIWLNSGNAVHIAPADDDVSLACLNSNMNIMFEYGSRTHMFMSSMSINGEAAAQSASALASRAFPTRLLSPARFGHAGNEASGFMIGNTRRSMSISGDLAPAVGSCSIPLPPPPPAPGLLPPPPPPAGRKVWKNQ